MEQAKNNQYEQEYFTKLQTAMAEDIERSREDIEYRSKAIKAQKKYMRDSHGDMDDEEFLQNMQNVNNDTLFVEHASKRLERLVRQKENPYFGKIKFFYDEDDEEIPLYIGMNGYLRTGQEEQLVYDWRAPVSNLYYNDCKGPASYKSPDGVFSGRITEKKQFDISKGKLREIVDVDENINDSILMKVLGKNSSTKMKSVVATIQKEQNAIIRNTTASCLVVDGRAGSGKTVIAMHRLAWLLYNNRKTLKADNVVVLSPNGVFGDYISGILPELGEDNVPEKEFDSLMEEILFVDAEYENKLEQADVICEMADFNNPRMENIRYKSSIAFYRLFREYLDEYIKSISFKDFHFEKVEYTKEQITKMFTDRFVRYPVYERFEKIAYFIADQVEDIQNKDFSNEKKQKLIKQIQQEMIYQYAERNLVEIYRRFLSTLEEEHPHITEVTNAYGKICYEDILPIFYLQVYFYGCNSYHNIKHLVIDEMQDYNIFQYAVLDRLFRCRMTILGDSCQVLFYDEKETVVDVLREVFERGKSNAGFELKELFASYRSTCEITRYTNQILGNGMKAAEVIERHGKEPERVQFADEKTAAAYIAEKLQYGDMDSYDNIAVICYDEAQAYSIYKQLYEYTEVTLLTGMSSIYIGGVVVLPRFLAKGMEFDVAFVFNYISEEENVINRQSLYIACTRALNELYVMDVEDEMMYIS
ncbi:MAG: superfamily I DNA and RNA helicase [Coprococcus sp.]|nr:superfamily I DNA and RNA helicase [Coprococcus sp.]